MVIFLRIVIVRIVMVQAKMNNYIFKTCVGGIIGAQQRRQELDYSKKFFHSYQLEDAKAFCIKVNHL